MGDIRVHSDAVAAQRVAERGAVALAAGPHLWFGHNRFAPATAAGDRLLRHEVSHVVQQRMRGAGLVAHQVADAGVDLDTDRDGDVAADVDVDSPRTPSAVTSFDPTAEVRALIDALSGFTSGWDQARIVQILTTHDQGATLAIYRQFFEHGSEFGLSAQGMWEWIREDVTSYDWRAIRSYAFQHSAVPNLAEFAAREIIWEVGAYTTDDSETQVVALLTSLDRGSLDSVLAELERQRGVGIASNAEWLFGQSSTLEGLDRVAADRLARALMGASERGLRYVSSYHARAVHSLLDGATSAADSTAIFRHFEQLSDIGRVLLMQRLRELVVEGTAENWLRQDMTASDYMRLRGLAGMELDERAPETATESALGWLEFGGQVIEVGLCGLVGVATGLLSAVWDLVRTIWDLAVAAVHCVRLAMYLLTGGALGRSSYQAFREFWNGLTHLFTHPATTFDAWWAEVVAGFETIEGVGADCRRAEYAVRHVVGAIVNVILVFAGGYGAARGAASATRTAVTALSGVRRGEVVVEAVGAARRTGGAVVTGAVGALASLRGLMASGLWGALATVLERAQAAITRISLAAREFEVWSALRRGVAAEREFWAAERTFWGERSSVMQAEQDALIARLRAVSAAPAAEMDAAITAATPQAQALDTGANSLLREVTAEGWTAITAWDEGPTARVASFHARPASDLPQLSHGYAWGRQNGRWVVFRAQDAPDVPLALYYWPADPEGNWSAVVVRTSDGARISSVSTLRAESYSTFPEARREHDWNFQDGAGRTFDEGHIAEQSHTVRSPESRVEPTGDRMIDREFYSSEHEMNFTPEPRWWNQDARNQLFGLIRNARPGRPSSFMPQRGTWADARRYRMLQEFRTNPTPMVADASRGPVVAADFEWLIVQDGSGEVLDAFRVPFGFAAPDARAAHLGTTWEQLLRQFRRPLNEVPRQAILAAGREALVAPNGSWWALVVAAAIDAVPSEPPER